MSIRGPRASTWLRAAVPALLAVLVVVGITMSRMQTRPPARVEAAPDADAGPEREVELEPTATETGTEPSRAAIEAKTAPPAKSAATPPPHPPPPSNGIRLVGDVLDPEGRFVTEGRAQIGIEDARGPRSVPTLHGRFRVDGLAAGPLAIECRVQGYRLQWRPIELQPGEIEHREDFTLDAVWNLDVRLATSDGREISTPESMRAILPAVPLAFRVSHDPPPEHWDSDGYDARVALQRAHFVSHFRTRSAFARLEPLVDPPFLLSADIAGNVVGTARVDTRADEVVLRISTERLSSLHSSFACRVIDGASNVPLANVRASLLVLGTGPGVPVLVSDAAGQIRADDLPVGNYILQIDEPKFFVPMPTVELLPGKTTDVGTIELEAPVEIAGRCVDAEGKPVCGAFRLLPCRADDPLDRGIGWWSSEVSTGIDGSFRKAITPSLYVVSSAFAPVTKGRRELRPRAAIFDLRNGPLEDLVVTFDATRLVALMPRSTEAKRYVYRILTTDGAQCDQGEVGLPRAGKIGLVPGSYRLLVGPDAAHMREIPFTVDDGPVRVPIET